MNQSLEAIITHTNIRMTINLKFDHIKLNHIKLNHINLIDITITSEGEILEHID